MDSSEQSKAGKTTSYVYCQLFGVVVLILCVVLLALNINYNLKQFDLSLDWSFLEQKSGFGITQKWLSHNSYHNNLNVLLVGIVNTIAVSLLAIIVSTELGVIVALCSRSRNPLIRGTGRVYIHVFRNVPLLVQILFWYNIWVLKTPTVANTWHAGMLALNNRGIYFPEIGTSHGMLVWLMGFWLAHVILLRLFQYRKIASYSIKRYQLLPVCVITTTAYIVIIIAAFWLSGSLIAPEIGRFNVSGYHVYPEFIALLLGLSLYTGAYNAESIRGAILSIPAGQQEAAETLSMSAWQCFCQVILPQSVPGLIPPLTSHYVNCTKNSSLGLAVGYPEVFAIFAGTVLNQTGRAFEIIAIIMAVYASLSMLTIFSMNWISSRQRKWTDGVVK